MRIVELAERYSFKKPEKGKKIPLSDIFRDVCVALGKDPELVKARSNKRELVYPRQIFCYVSRCYTNYILQDIAIEAGYREHSMVKHCVAKIKDLIHVKDSQFMEQFETYKENSRLWKELSA